MTTLICENALQKKNVPDCALRFYGSVHGLMNTRREARKKGWTVKKISVDGNVTVRNRYIKIDYCKNCKGPK